MNVWVIVPGYNESLYLDKVLRRLIKEHKNVVFVDDGSSDTSAEIAGKYTPHVIVHEINLGKGAAMRTGAEYAFSHLKADAVIFMDADDQHDSKEVHEFIKKLKSGYDLVFGVRDLGTDVPLVRFLGNKIASVLLNLLFQRYIPDIPSGYKALSQRGFEQVRWEANDYSVEVEIAVRAAKEGVNYSMIDIQAIYHDTDKGMTLLDGIAIARRLLLWRLRL